MSLRHFQAKLKGSLPFFLHVLQQQGHYDYGSLAMIPRAATLVSACQAPSTLIFRPPCWGRFQLGFWGCLVNEFPAGAHLKFERSNALSCTSLEGCKLFSYTHLFLLFHILQSNISSREKRSESMRLTTWFSQSLGEVRDEFKTATVQGLKDRTSPARGQSRSACETDSSAAVHILQMPSSRPAVRSLEPTPHGRCASQKFDLWGDGGFREDLPQFGRFSFNVFPFQQSMVGRSCGVYAYGMVAPYSQVEANWCNRAFQDICSVCMVEDLTDFSGVPFVYDIWSVQQRDIFLLEPNLLEYIFANLGYEDAGDFTVVERLKTSLHENLVFYLCVGSVGLVGLVLFVIFSKNWSGDILGFAMACSNTFGLVTGAFLLGFGLSEIPKGIWKNVDWTFRHKVLSHKVAKMAVKLDDAHQEFSSAIVVAQATSNQIKKRDPLRPYMNIIDSMLYEMLKEDPSFKPQGGRFGENDMDYNTDQKSMATLRRRLRIAREEYCRYRSEYTSFVLEALELEDTIKNYELRNITGWKFVSSFKPERTGKLGSSFDMMEFVWRCVLRKQLEKLFAIILCCMSAAILLAEATILPVGVDLSLCSILINSVGKQEMLVQDLTPKCIRMVARYAPPISYNFLNLIHFPDNRKTIFEKRMGNIDDAVPFFGKGFNKIYPLIMVIYTLLHVANFFDLVIDYFGNWRSMFNFQEQDEDTDGFDPSGLIILQKERALLERGHNVGEHIIPLARNFGSVSVDIEPSSNEMEMDTAEIGTMREFRPLKEEVQQVTSREAIDKKYSTLREQNKQASNTKSAREESTSFKSATRPPPERSASKWESMNSGLLNFKSILEVKKYLPLRQTQENTVSSLASSSESLDEIFQRLKRPTLDLRDYNAENDLLF
ncbi:LMBR1-like membrane protein isoform 2 [Hibiscus syriacus]|uniref:LMBR1-like membrane protein isoform 2 n=1 Tax=Hibiscus syriacus TaxID=106335 RepID=A0A6A3BI73_HIBSY|nr:LMBR1-like membrane protein isoform 2 [Hibiscus syriacus]